MQITLEITLLLPNRNKVTDGISLYSENSIDVLESFIVSSMENLADISEPQYPKMSKKINKFNFQSVYSVSMRKKSNFSH